MAEATRTLIVNGDDFGMTAGVNAGIAAAFERGILTSASLMVRQRQAPAAAACAAGAPALAVGLHLDLEGRDYAGGGRLEGWHCDLSHAASVEAECRIQLRRFRELIGRDPTHLDSHHHLHLREPVAGVAARLADELGVPLRAQGIRYEGGFFGRTGTGEPVPEAIEPKALIAILRALPPGVTELGCHPGLEMQGESSYAEERRRELRTLCDPAVREAIERERIRLASFAEFPSPA